MIFTGYNIKEFLGWVREGIYPHAIHFSGVKNGTLMVSVKHPGVYKRKFFYKNEFYSYRDLDNLRSGK